MNNKKLKVYLCDLTYDTIVLVSDTIPINIGFIGSYIKKNLAKMLKYHCLNIQTKQSKK